MLFSKRQKSIPSPINTLEKMMNRGAVPVFAQWLQANFPEVASGANYLPEKSWISTP